MPEEVSDKMIHAIENALETRQKGRLQHELIIKSKNLWFDCSVTPLAEGKVVWVAHEISHLRDAEEDTRKHRG